LRGIAARLGERPARCAGPGQQTRREPRLQAWSDSEEKQHAPSRRRTTRSRHDRQGTPARTSAVHPPDATGTRQDGDSETQRPNILS